MSLLRPTQRAQPQQLLLSVAHISPVQTLTQKTHLPFSSGDAGRVRLEAVPGVLLPLAGQVLVRRMPQVPFAAIQGAGAGGGVRLWRECQHGTSVEFDDLTEDAEVVEYAT